MGPRPAPTAGEVQLMAEITIESPTGMPDDAQPAQPGQPQRTRVVVHRLDGGLEDGESDTRIIGGEGFPVYSLADPTRARFVPTRDIKYIVFGTVDDPSLPPDPGDGSPDRKAIIRFRDGEWIAA